MGVTVQDITMVPRHIHIEASLTRASSPFNLTVVYVPPQPARQGQVWSFLSNIALHTNSPLLLVGDFNNVFSPSKKLRSCPLRSS